MKRAASAFIFLFALQLVAQDTPERRRAVSIPPADAANDVEISQINLPASASHVISVLRCTLVDTRNPVGPFGGPRMFAGETRSYIIPNGPCSGIPVALGYALIFTAIGPDSSPVHLQAWPTGGALTPALTLSRGTASNPNDTAPRSAAIEASSSGSINVTVDVGTDLLIELNAYYTPGVVVSTVVTPPLSGGGTGNVTIGIPDGAISNAKLATITTAGKVANSATTATSANTPNAIVLRDGAGGFAAGALTLSGKIDQTSVDGLVARGTVNSGTIPASGPGARLMWYPRKAAFRAGSVDGTQWDDASIGSFSTAMGAGPTASGYGSTAMGDNTIASGADSTAIGYFTIATGQDATAMGFLTFAGGNLSTAMGDGTSATGLLSTAMGYTTFASGNYSTAMGVFASTNGHAGAFAYGDSSTIGSMAIVTPSSDNQFVVRAAGGTTFYSNSALTTGVSLAANGTSWATVSDRNSKEDFRDINGEEILNKLAALPVTSWRYKNDDSGNRYIGPMAQDFHALFGLGTDTTIATLDVDGVTLAALKALVAEVERLKREVEELKAQQRR